MREGTHTVLVIEHFVPTYGHWIRSSSGHFGRWEDGEAIKEAARAGACAVGFDSFFLEDRALAEATIHLWRGRNPHRVFRLVEHTYMKRVGGVAATFGPTPQEPVPGWKIRVHFPNYEGTGTETTSLYDSIYEAVRAAEDAGRGERNRVFTGGWPREGEYTVYSVHPKNGKQQLLYNFTIDHGGKAPRK